MTYGESRSVTHPYTHKIRSTRCLSDRDVGTQCMNTQTVKSMYAAAQHTNLCTTGGYVALVC